MTTRFIALIDSTDGTPGAYGVAFPDAPGCTAMGATMDEAIRNASLALAEWAEDGAPVARTADELRLDPEVAELLAAGSAMVVVAL